MNETISEISAHLAFDSYVDAAPAVRGDGPGERHLIYEGGGITLDLVVRHEPRGAIVHVSGQILTQGEDLSDVAGVEVLMTHGSRNRCTRTNALGEFSFQTSPNGTLDLTIAMDERCFRVVGLATCEPRLWQVAEGANSQ